MENNNSNFYLLIDRLQKCSELKYPDRKWSKEFYDQCAFHWKGKENQLEERVLKLENEINLENLK